MTDTRAGRNSSQQVKDASGRRRFIKRQALWCTAAGLGVSQLAGCMQPTAAAGETDLIYGKNGYSKGQFQKPRAICIDENDEIYIVDLTGRIQVFDTDGKYQRHWKTPDIKNGRPTGLSVGRDGVIWVPDTHYFQALAYTTSGEMLKDRCIVGKAGVDPGDFGMLTEVAEDSRGRLYLSEYGENDRVQVFSSAGEFLFQIGSHGTEDGQFMRPQATAIDSQDRLWVADAGNHRIQVFKTGDASAELEMIIGSAGTEPGQMRIPYDLFFDEDENLFVCEFGNHRVQKLSQKGESLWMWSSQQSGPTALYQPWGCVMDSKKRLHLLDSYHHRVYRIPTVG